MTCRELVGATTDYLEGALPEARRMRFEAHLEECPACGRHLEQMRLTIAALGRLSEEPLSARARNCLLAAFREWRGVA